MRYVLPSVVLLASLAGGCKPREASTVPTLVVDDAHSALKHTDGSEHLRYSIPAASGVVLDASAYAFKGAPGAPQQPNAVNVIVGKDAYYGEWKPSGGRQRLDASTLTPIGDAPAFAGFPSHASVMLGIGHVVDPKAPDFQFSVIWAGMADVE